MASDIEGNLKTLREEVWVKCRSHLPALNCFHPTSDITKEDNGDVEIKDFVHLVDEDPRDEPDDISLASTATCIGSLTTCPEYVSKNKSYESLNERLKDRKDTDKGLTSADLKKDNPFTVGLLLPALKETGVDSDDELVQHCLNKAEGCLDQNGVHMPPLRSRTRSRGTEDEDRDNGEDQYPPHGYLTYWCLRGSEAYKGIEDTIDLAGDSLAWSKEEFYKQLMYFAAGVDDEFDAYQLGYNLLIQYRYNRHNIREAIFDFSLQTLFDAQLDRGIWEKKKPLFVYGRRGDAYCFPFELFSSLLSEFSNEFERLRPFEDNLVKAWNWIQRNQKDYRKNGETIPLWRSGDIVRTTKPESWATAEIYRFTELLYDYLSWRIQNTILDHFRHEIYTTPNKNKFEEIYLCKTKDESDQSGDPVYIKELLNRQLIKPLKVQTGDDNDHDRYTLANKDNADQISRSAILFGPPGTGKTMYVKAIAERLGWPIVLLDPSNFASKGLSLIPSETTRIFDMLMELEDVVIFFDEMEELIQERKDKDAGKSSFEQRYLTTTFLPRLQELKDKSRSLFFIATNYYEDLDNAVTREGRFDLKLFIPPPTIEEKKCLIANELGVNEVPDSVSDAIDREAAKLMTFIETQKLASRIDDTGTECGGLSDWIDIIEEINPRLEQSTKSDKIVEYLS
jgi:hypothetical protein